MQNFSEIYKDLLRRIEELESENQSLRNAIQILNTNYETLKAENAILKAENTALKAENTALKIENSTLKEKLGLNSTNSGIPTSKELYKIKKDHHHKSTRHPGGQPGHKGAIREDMIPGEIIEIPITNICSCGGKVILSDPHIHQKIDIPEIKPHVKEYHLQNGHCIKCGKKIAAKLPDEIGYDLFGFRTKAIISALTGFYKNSKRETTKIMNNIFNLKISLGTISNTEKRVSKKCQNTYQQIKDEVTDEKILHLDETSHYNKGKLGWCWMATNNRTSFIKLADSRAMKILTEIIPKYDGTVITDRYAAYNYFPKENRQICLAHLARDFERFANSANIEIRMIGIYLRDMIQELFAIKKAFQTNKISKLIFDRRAKKIRRAGRKNSFKISFKSTKMESCLTNRSLPTRNISTNTWQASPARSSTNRPHKSRVPMPLS